MEASELLIKQDPCFRRFLVDTGATPVSGGATNQCAAIP